MTINDQLNALDSATIPEWIQARIGKFTASEMWKLFTNPRSKGAGISETALSYIKQKAAEVLTGEPTPQIVARAIEYGNQNEPDAFMWYRDHFRFGTIFDKGDITYHGIANPLFIPYGEHAGGSVDALIGTDGILGIKCPWNSDVHLEYMMMKAASELPKEYYIQAQCELKFTGRTYFHFVSYNPRMIKPEHRMTLINVYPDLDMHEEIDRKIEWASEYLISILDSL